MQVLGARFVPAVESALLINRQARYAASQPRFGGQPTGGEGFQRVVEVQCRRITLDAVTVCIEDHRMHVDPPVSRRGDLDPQRQPVGLDLIAELGEYAQADIKAGGVNGKIKITMGTSLPADQGIDTPAASDPAPHTRRAQLVEDLDHFRQLHPTILTAGAGVRPGRQVIDNGSAAASAD